jgi:2-C-methyl-D-erythritol 4-phosphate cytidylyltransferase
VKATALVLAAGSGERLGARVPKAFVPLAGETLLERSIERLARVSLVNRVVPVVPAEYVEAWRARGPKRADAVAGGVRRQDSVRAGLDALPDEVEWVAVHDAARCLVDERDIEAVIRAAQDSGAAILAHRSPDTVKLVRGDVVESTPERGACWAAETPQVFRLDLLREGLEKAAAEGFTATDDAQLVERLGIAVRIVESSSPNLKITHADDLKIAQALLAAEPLLAEGSR